MKQNLKKIEESKERMPLSIKNYLLMLAGAVVIVIGFIVLSGGTKATPETFSYDIYSWPRMYLAPILIVAGFAFEVFAILKRFEQ
jgi:cytochrome bd-type quinol oxidase subunit 2